MRLLREAMLGLNTLIDADDMKHDSRIATYFVSDPETDSVYFMNLERDTEYPIQGVGYTVHVG